MSISELRILFEDYNKKTLQERLRRNDLIEEWIRSTINYHGYKCGDEVLNNWQKCDAKDDRKFKRDIYQDVGGKRLYGQLKWRQPNSGGDIEAAIIQPYYNLDTFKQVTKDEPEKLRSHVWARDYLFDGEFYACLNKTWDVLRVIPLPAIKKRIHTVIKEWWESDQNLTPYWQNNTFHSSAYNGVQLKCTTDKGRASYDSGLWKILCYMPITCFENGEVILMDMVEPPVLGV